LIVSALFGFGGSFISLWLSRPLAKMMVNAKLIDENSTDEFAKWLRTTVLNIAYSAKVPIGDLQVALYNGTPNAFATGWSKKHALVAVSSGLIDLMDKEQIKAVIAHEVTHIANGDMVTMSLLQGILNTYVIFFSRVIAFMIDAASKGKNKNKTDSRPSFLYYFLADLLENIFCIFASIVLCSFSRKREYAADKGAANLCSPASMISALEALGSISKKKAQGGLPRTLQAFGINRSKGAWSDLFATHPSLENRIKSLMQLQVTA